MRASRAEKVSAIEIMPKITGVKAGTIDRIDADGSVWVDFAGNLAGPVKARMTGTMAKALRAAEGAVPPPVVLAFEEQDPGRPVILDIVCERLEEDTVSVNFPPDGLEDVRVDGRTVTFDAQEQIVLRCGKASITLTQAGKVLIRGAYLSTHASGVHRIKGGSVQIN
jgi:hypothetical protein